ncbi:MULTISPECIES: benzoate/H(+) symporter BenE family transporter [unclassified Neisseria]|uniref:benzoate/H(+) symporter BenE family transporter n=1 Tax=unclassified Neisseria TaxID=2623750 RepID=UPI001071818E|nr:MULTISPECIES: benzoate/H(+) symporter BenE family transporter [unclassified Neisseria]MBF0804704.1 benzoate/H(+) symporter BenE family transporter [Neisseria sp. 19428wB4_WF04]TFU40279.1 benzoate/H(+) symporter BenE family transporter [Neisseria sp. WF04]
MPKLTDFSASHFSAAVAAFLVSYGSSAVIIYQAALAFGASPSQTVSWFTALPLVCGVLTLGLSLRYKAPVMIAWCTPGAAVLAGLGGIGLNDAVTGFMAAAAAMWLVSALGWFDRLVRMIPAQLAAAMLAGILIHFGSRVFAAMSSQTALVGVMLAVFFLTKIRLARYSILLMLAAGVGYAAWSGLIDQTLLVWRNPVLEWVGPGLHFGHTVSVAVPLFIASLATQNVPGMAVLRGYGYQTPARPLVESSAAATLLAAPFGAFMVNLAAISSAICMGSDVDKNPERRYLATLLLGVVYLLAAAAGGITVAMFAALPAELTASLAGIAVFGTLQANLAAAWQCEHSREAALVTLLASASGMTLWGISSAFWGLVLGLAVYHLNLKTAK